MSISRRQFILGTAAGLILPSYFDRAFSYFENTGEALLEVPRNTQIELIASFDLGDEYELNLGDPYQEPPEMTVREYACRYYAGEEDYLNWIEEDDVDLDAKMDFWDIIDTWARHDSPNARAYRLLENLDLGPELCGENAVGEINFIDGPCPGNDYLGVHAPTQLDLSLLQARLNGLNTGIRLSVGET